jgi:hypothetical protein
MKSISLCAAFATVVISGAALAQAPVPLQRSIEQYEPLRAKVAAAASEPQEVGQPPVPTVRDTPSGGMAKDRFGNAIRGDTCSAHWANCAYDPQRPAR